MKPPSPSTGDSDSRHELRLPALAWVRRAHATEELIAAVDRQVRRRRRNRLTTFAAVLVVGLAGSLFWRERTATPDTLSTAAVPLPVWRSLPDGSTAELKPGAQIEFEYGPDVRRIRLRNGEAHFRVVPGERPFIVQAGSVQVRAVGTEFAVQLGVQQVEVLVTEGRVQVAGEPRTPIQVTTASAPTMAMAAQHVVTPVLAAGQRAVVSMADATSRIEAVSEVEIAEHLAWRVPQLEFSRTPLAEVVLLMNRYAEGRSGLKFEVSDAELKNVTLSGFLRADNTDGLVRLLETNFGVAAERAGGIISLRKAREPVQ